MIAGGSTVRPMLSDSFWSELTDSKASKATLKGNYLWLVVEIVIGGVPNVLEIHFMR
jgi:hypothetical protein